MPDKNASNKKHDKKTQKTLLEEYFKNKNLGQMLFKIATMGNKGKERWPLIQTFSWYNHAHVWQFRYLATITVDNVQYKTYPQTYSTKEEAEEALSDLVIKKLGQFTSFSLHPN